ncbi:apolipoprotein N-acyltransferase [Luteipulveratus halotolerans]|uniref:Apolipoprotein N-acyltransferase n=1 Tax=Luteipulveratus halotolerans TaxID=1631356 RepID=A0A0L6CH09_9MICO|nr:apolipoprotein N-acyltransferase [Luteipulveratus halotolerans]KNX37091.1 apolipoprotein acyltransferase [Luteipulveratus halotolerans]
MLRRSLIAVASGLCLWLALPTIDLWPLAFVGVAGMAWATVGVSARAGLGLGLLTGLGCFVPALSWSGVYVGAVPWMALAVTESLYVAALGLACAVVQPIRVRPWLIACLWVAQELIRGTVPFGGFPWARIAFSQADSPLVHLASVAGAPGVTFAVALVGGWLAVAAERARVRDFGRLPALRPLVASAGVLLLAALWPVATGGRAVTVAGIQGNVPQSGLDFNAQRRAVLDNHVRTTNRLAADVRAGRTPAPDLVVWPENSSDIDPLRNADAATEITEAVSAIGVPVMVGAVLQEPSPRVSNATLLYVPGRGIVDRYVKQHPVPFAEYIPYRSFFRTFSTKVDLVTKDFAPGKEPSVFAAPTPSGTVKVGPVICFEVAYDDLTREPVRRGAQLLAVQTNNATFGRTAESEQQLAISRLRAIEHGRSIVHISTVGVSALITPDGTTHDQSSLFTQKALVGELPLRTATTWADRVGRIPELLATLVGAVALVQAVRVRRAAKVTDRAGVPTPATDHDTRQHHEKDVHDRL